MVCDHYAGGGGGVGGIRFRGGRCDNRRGEKRVSLLVFGCFYICCTLQQQLAGVGVAVGASIVQRGIV